MLNMRALTLSFLIIKDTESFLKNSFFLNSTVNVVSFTIFNLSSVYNLFRFSKKKINYKHYRCLLLDTTPSCSLLLKFCTAIRSDAKDYLLIILFKYENDLFNLLKVAEAINSSSTVLYEHFFITSLKVRNYAYLFTASERSLTMYVKDHLLFLFFSLRQYLNYLNSFFINVHFTFSFTEFYFYII